MGEMFTRKITLIDEKWNKWWANEFLSKICSQAHFKEILMLCLTSFSYILDTPEISALLVWFCIKINVYKLLYASSIQNTCFKYNILNKTQLCKSIYQTLPKLQFRHNFFSPRLRTFENTEEVWIIGSFLYSDWSSKYISSNQCLSNYLYRFITLYFRCIFISYTEHLSLVNVKNA